MAVLQPLTRIPDRGWGYASAVEHWTKFLITRPATQTEEKSIGKEKRVPNPAFKKKHQAGVGNTECT